MCYHVSGLVFLLQLHQLTHDACISSLFLFFQARIEQLVTAMGGLLQTKVSMDVNFVVAKDVLAAKYKVSYAESC
jgi:hypothetical protein